MSDLKMSDVFEIVPYAKGDVRPEYILMNGKALNIYGAKKVLEANQELIAKLQADNELLRSQLSVPMQPVIDNRFKENKIVRYCLENSTDLNQLAMIDFSVEDREQFAQLIGYSLGGYGDLSYVTDESYYRAAELAATAKG